MLPDNYSDALQWLFSRVAAFHNVGATAYKPGLERVEALSACFGNPHGRLRCIHVAGTNGKGSVSSTLAAVLRSAGYRTGLYTSPHLVDFRERIRVDGEMITEQEVMDFLRTYDRDVAHDRIDPSFFELATVMAFDHFVRRQVDIAVVEVGLGGRLDSTNIIMPQLSVITNISPDHTALLGNSRAEIAREKAGIIKPGIPVVVGETDAEVGPVFALKARECDAPVVFADTTCEFTRYERIGERQRYHGTPFGMIDGELCGECQAKNAATIFAALRLLRDAGLNITDEAVASGFANVVRLSGLMGRWQTVDRDPLTIIDTGHNIGGWNYIVDNLNAMPGRKIVVVGFVNDKDVATILDRMRAINDARFIFTAASVARALPAEELVAQARAHGLDGEAVSTVAEAARRGRSEAIATDATLFIGGSNFVVADWLSLV